MSAQPEALEHDYLRRLCADGLLWHSEGMPEHTLCSALPQALDQIDRLHALNAQMLEALGALLEGCEYKSFDGEEPKWHRKSMARDSALELARIAIAAAKEQA